MSRTVLCQEDAAQQECNLLCTINEQDCVGLNVKTQECFNGRVNRTVKFNQQDPSGLTV